MNELTPLFDHVRTLIEQLIPANVSVPLTSTGPIALAVVGFIVAALGAKLARMSLALATAVGGAMLGVAVGQWLEVALPASGLVGGVVFGFIGFFLHRLWIAVIACVLFSAAAGGAIGYRTVWPELQSYDVPLPEIVVPKSEMSATTDGTSATVVARSSFTVWCDEEWPKYEQWFDGLWSHVSANDSSTGLRFGLAAAAAGLIGFMLGLMAVRFTTVVVTSVVGTGLIVSGLGGAAYQWWPEAYEGGVNHPQAVGVACAAVLFGSLVVQTLLTRTDKGPVVAPRPSTKQA
jgi:ABC-type cobalt transport system substrate-binding protein